MRSAEVTYTAGETILIFDSAVTSSKFKLLNKSGKEISQNVYAVELALWNSGDLPIPPEDARQPLCFEVSSSEVLDFSILKATRQNIANFQIHKASSNSAASTGRLCIKWKYFDPNFGFRLRLVYAAEEPSKVNLAGYIVGVSNFYDGTELVINRYIPYNSPFRILLFFVPTLWIGLIAIFLSRVRYLHKQVWLQSLILGVVGLGSMYMWVLFTLRTPTPPV